VLGQLNKKARRMQVEPSLTSSVVNRIKRAQGQLAGVLRMIEEGRDHEEVLNQIKAVSKALDRAGFAVLACELRHHVSAGTVSDDDLDEIEKLFLSLA
jgi:DNA-binding FrmR family transcriptional regulator